MKKHFLALCALCTFTAFQAQSRDLVHLTGKTNINTFKCLNTKIKKSEPISIASVCSTAKPVVSIPVASFDCGSKIINKEFQKTLQSTKYPFITIKFISVEQIAKNRFAGWLEVKMMNNSKRYSVDFTQNGNQLAGKKDVYFSDFNIVPPKSMGGMLVTHDRLDLFFNLEVTP